MLLHGTAPSKTRGSFVAAALSTLQLFINEYVANCTQKSDFDLRQFAREKTAIYVLLPDDRETYHKLASLLVQQIYTSLVELSRQEGGELKIRMNFVLDEFANFTKIDTFQSMLTVSRGRNIRFIICLQSFAKIEEKYGKEVGSKLIKTMEMQTRNHSSEDIFKATTQYKNSIDYSLNVYTKGALAFNEVRKKVGDEVFFETLKEYYNTYMFQNVNGAKFVDLWNKKGIDIDKIISEYK